MNTQIPDSPLQRLARFFLAIIASLLVVSLLPATSAMAGGQPKLILQITVDALRGDLPSRFSNVLGEGGFRYLMEQGIHYTETIVGHVSLATGTVPAAHGMVGNVWFDRELGRIVYNIEDARYHLLTAGAGVDKKSEIDATQKTAKSDGRSPDNILTSTFSDELAIHFAGRSKIFAVSVKDRGAVSLAGHADNKAHYFDTSALDKAPAIAALKKQFGIGEELIEKFFFPYLYLNHEVIRTRGLDQAAVEQAVAAELLKFKGVAYAVSSTALRTDKLPETLMMRAILRNFHPKRSGDIYLVFEPNVFINGFDGMIVDSTHGSPWRYDTFVPVIFAGAGLKPARVERPITPYDIAPTLAAYLSVKPPSGSIGIPLSKVLEK